ncbi:hypothetical protein K402DRAFT_419406 [Aulographum hederae CBS 113979]|uniref:Uncharacterized protein n=1 Tax=Aulographum hederae CBS 113979 TaxID=1176131 RepID=A0A6G1H5S2_9PEZI|nr:hypothetical protein K402DRAFT_419406 [Aulographum hederae CBS 113979]
MASSYVCGCAMVYPELPLSRDLVTVHIGKEWPPPEKKIITLDDTDVEVFQAFYDFVLTKQAFSETALNRKPHGVPLTLLVIDKFYGELWDEPVKEAEGTALAYKNTAAIDLLRLCLVDCYLCCDASPRSILYRNLPDEFYHDVFGRMFDLDFYWRNSTVQSRRELMPHIRCYYHVTMRIEC